MTPLVFLFWSPRLRCVDRQASPDFPAVQKKDMRRKKKVAEFQLWGWCVTCSGKDHLEGGVEQSSPVKLAVIYSDISSVLTNAELLFLILVQSCLLSRVAISSAEVARSFTDIRSVSSAESWEMRSCSLETIRFRLSNHLRPPSTSPSEKINDSKASTWFQWSDRCGLFSLFGFLKTSEVRR